MFDSCFLATGILKFLLFPQKVASKRASGNFIVHKLK